METPDRPQPKTAPDSSPLVRVELFGGLRLHAGGTVVTRFSTRKTAALLAYLAYYRDRDHPRETLVDLLWPESGLKSGRRSLSVALSELRRDLEPPGTPPGSVILTDRFSVRLDPEAVQTDVGDFEEALTLAAEAQPGAERLRRLLEAAERYGGTLLPGCAEDWTVREQRHLDDRMARALRELLDLQEQTGDLAGAAATARRAVELQPLHEAAHREVMRLLGLAGRTTEALQQYHQLERLLRKEVDALPSAETRALARELSKQANAPDPIGDADPPALPRPAPSSDTPLGVRPSSGRTRYCNGPGRW